MSDTEQESKRVKTTVKIIEAKPLDAAIGEKLSKDLMRQLALEKEDLDDERLLEQDFVVWEVEMEDIKFKFYHGFPGDNPVGVLVSMDEIIATVGEGGSEVLLVESIEAVKAKEFVLWYDQVTEEACHYEMKEFKASQL